MPTIPKQNADRRRKLANNPSVQPEMRDYIKQLNAKVSWGPTSTSTTTTTTTTTTGA